MVSFTGKKKALAMPGSVSFRGLIQNFRKASPPFSNEEPSFDLLKIKFYTETEKVILENCQSP